MKKGYIIVRLSVTDSDLFQKYPPLSSTAMEKYGGKYKVRGGQSITKEGVEFERNIVIEFDSYQLAQEAYTSEEYNHAKLVLGSDKDRILSIVEGT